MSFTFEHDLSPRKIERAKASHVPLHSLPIPTVNTRDSQTDEFAQQLQEAIRVIMDQEKQLVMFVSMLEEANDTIADLQENTSKKESVHLDAYIKRCEEIEELKRHLKALQEEKECLKASSDSLFDRYIESCEELNQLRNSPTTTRDAAVQTDVEHQPTNKTAAEVSIGDEYRVSVLEADLARTRATVENLQTSLSITTDIADASLAQHELIDQLYDEKAGLQKETEDLKRQLLALREKADAADALSDSLSSAADAVDQVIMQRELIKQLAADAEDLQERNEGLETENRALAKKADKLWNDLCHMLNQNSELEAVEMELEAKCEALDRQKLTLGKKTGQNQRLKAQVQSLLQEKASLESTVQQLNRKLHQVSIELAPLTVSIVNMNNPEVELHGLRTEVRRLERALHIEVVRAFWDGFENAQNSTGFSSAP